jgi:hypothetical protein
MRCGRIADGDCVFRSCVHPRSFNRGGRQFAVEKLFYLAQGLEEGVFLGSLIWDRFAPTLRAVHEYGCRVAEKANSKGGRSRSVYCGAYGLRARAIRSIAGANELGEVRSVTVEHLVEQGEIAHAELRIVVEAGARDIETTKTAVIDRLWNASWGPVRHVCPCDTDLANHPSVQLPAAPLPIEAKSTGSLGQLLSEVRAKTCGWWCRLRVLLD